MPKPRFAMNAVTPMNAVSPMLGVMSLALVALAATMAMTLTAPAQAFTVGERLLNEKSNAEGDSKAGDSKAAPDKPQSKDNQTKNRVSNGYRELEWEELMPKDWDPAAVLRTLNLDALSDSDPRADQALERLRKEWQNAPARPELANSKIRIPGFVVPLDPTGKSMSEFLLVPYFGACIHVPPPPSNQVIHVAMPKNSKTRLTIKSMDAVWVSGTLALAQVSTGMGDASYTLTVDDVKPYKEK